MIIRCPNCRSTYDISKQPQAAGRKVKCMRCSHVWKAESVDATAPPAGKRVQAESGAAIAAPPPPPSEVAVSRPAAVHARAAEARSVTGMSGDTADQHMDDGERRAATRARNELNGSDGDHRGNGFAADDRYDTPMPPATQAARRSSHIDAAPQAAHRQAAGSLSDAGYYDVDPQRPARRPERHWREPPRSSYRDDVYGDPDQGYDQDEFTPTREGRRVRERPSRGRRAATIVCWVAYLAVLGALGAYAYAGRNQIAAWLPGASPYYADVGLPVNRFGLKFRDVKASWGKVSAGQAALAISVGVENITNDTVRVPTVVIAFKDAKGDELFYRAMVDALPRTLQSGKSARFSATLQVPADATRAIQVRFATGL
jgi:predicted Zn finger-like uncharacterized protein